MKRVILHCDMDNYFAAVEEKYNPALRRVPFAVCGDPEMRHSIVMSKNHLAKKAGVPTGISFRQAQQICPNLKYLTADFNKYLEQTKISRAVYMKYSDAIIPYGMDESWIDLGDVSYKEAAQIADIIRIEMMYTLGLSASLGVSFNYIFSKIGSDYRKPNTVTVVTPENYKDIVWPLPATDLLFVGNQRMKLLSGIGVSTIGDIACSNPEYLFKLLGKVGYDIWRFANGDDRTFNPSSNGMDSIGNTITPAADLYTNEDVSAILYLLATTVSTRLKKHKLKTRCISINLRDNGFNKKVRQCSFPVPTDNAIYIFNKAYALFTKHYKWEKPLRSSIGIRTDNLESVEQLTLLPIDECELVVDIDDRIKSLTERIGPLKIEKGAGLKEYWQCADAIPS